MKRPHLQKNGCSKRILSVSRGRVAWELKSRAQRQTLQVCTFPPSIYPGSIYRCIFLQYRASLRCKIIAESCKHSVHPARLFMTTPDAVERRCRTGTLTLGEDLTNEAPYSNKQEHIFALLLYPTKNPCCSRGGSPLIARKM